MRVSPPHMSPHCLFRLACLASLLCAYRRANSDPPSHFIPLGDSKQLSRRHFTLSFLHNHWHCVIKGKNAVVVGGTNHRREQLPSGQEGPEIQLRLADDRVTPLRIGDVRMW